MEKSPELTLPDVFDRSGERYGSRHALGFYDEPALTYRQLKEKIDQIAAFLAERGIVHGDRVAILSENGPHWGVAFLAVTSMGAVAVPILTDFHPSEIHHVLRHSEAKAVFVSEKLYAKIDDAEFDHLETRILIDDFSEIKPDTSKDKLRRLIAEGSHELRKIKTMALKWLGKIPSRVREDDLASIIYTSGTTGHSKGVMLTHRNIVSDAVATTRLVDVTSEDRFLSLLPLAHVYECTLGLDHDPDAGRGGLLRPQAAHGRGAAAGPGSGQADVRAVRPADHRKNGQGQGFPGASGQGPDPAGQPDPGPPEDDLPQGRGEDEGGVRRRVEDVLHRRRGPGPRRRGFPDRSRLSVSASATA